MSTHAPHSVAALAVLLAATILAAGCQPGTMHDSIYADVDRPPDPAHGTPYLWPEGPGRADTAQLPSANPPPTHQPTPPGPVTSVDTPEPNPLVRVWVDHQPADQPLGAKTARVSELVSLAPVVRFELTPRLGQFRSVAIQIYRVTNGRPDLATGLRIKELREKPDDLQLGPGLNIAITRLGDRCTVRRVATGETVSGVKLEPGQEYEIQFLIGASEGAEAMGVRILTAAPPPASRPDDVRPADEPKTLPLPPGVSIPNQR